MSNILERVVYNQLMAHLEQNGFRRKRSTELAVTHLTDAIKREAYIGNLTSSEVTVTILPLSILNFL